MRTKIKTKIDQKQAALQKLQTAIVRLSNKPHANRDEQRVELSELVEQALDSYRKYMETVEIQGKLREGGFVS